MIPRKYFVRRPGTAVREPWLVKSGLWFVESSTEPFKLVEDSLYGD